MARDVMDTELGYAISETNGDRQVYLISGTAVPDGTSGEQQNAPIGSLYIRSGTGELYQKIANAGAPADYQLNSATGGTIGNWRPERVDAHTGQVLGAGVTDPTGWSDNDGGFDGTLATVGHYVLDGNCALWEITAIGGATSITLAAAANPPVADDMFAVKYNLPDPAGQENQAIIVFDGSACVKVADVDFGSATGVVLVAPYNPVNGDPVAGDTVQAAIEKLDGNQDDIQAASGLAQGDVDYGTFTGDLLADAQTSKQLFQRLEDLLDQLKGVQATGITTAVAVDAVPHAEVKTCKWLVEVFSEGTPANRQAVEVYATTDGTNVDDTVYAKLKLGANIGGLTINVVINGANMELQIAASAAVTATVRRIEVVKSTL